MALFINARITLVLYLVGHSLSAFSVCPELVGLRYTLVWNWLSPRSTSTSKKGKTLSLLSSCVNLRTDLDSNSSTSFNRWSASLISTKQSSTYLTYVLGATSDASRTRFSTCAM